MDLTLLNEEQRRAAEFKDGPLLVLAGAGSGKTRALTYRIANLIEKHGVAPWNILALTFTNKAAREMRERVEALVGGSASDMWLTTFHSCCARILRRDADAIGYERNFVIYDDSDQMSVLSDIIKQMGIDEKELPKRRLKERISDAKNKSLNPIDYLNEDRINGETYAAVYKRYQKRLRDANALDFDDLLLKVIELFEHVADILEKYREKFQYVLVDEYQDTNMAQYRMLQLLCKERKNICVVGDDDQSIYGWRGADIRNILEFEKDFPGAQVVRLEQNYRSSSVILDAANHVIQNNASRKRKTLWTDSKGGELVELFAANNERMEADYICRKILEGRRTGRGYNEFAVLYRMNAQSRVLETMFVNYGIPHRIYGGTRFYERKEIKDILAYLRVIANPSDDVALARIINVPRRGIGDMAMQELVRLAENKGVPLLIAAMDGAGLSQRVQPRIKQFSDMITELMALRECMKLSDLAQALYERIGYEQYLKEDKRGESEARVENIRELIGNMMEVERDLPEESDSLLAFLESVSLISDIDNMDADEGAVSLMTLHSAKGLEFPVVFLAGMEENIFPSSRSKNDISALEEERRLCSVGITRAMEKLHLVYAKQSVLFGDYSYNAPSVFLSEIPDELIEDKSEHPAPVQQQMVRKSATPRVNTSMHRGFEAAANAAPARRAAVTAAEKSFSPYERVRHAAFGEGTVMDVSGSGNTMTVTIDFGAGGVKRFAAAYAPITPAD